MWVWVSRVMATLACPRRSWTNLGWTFLWNSSEAQVCRRSLKVIHTRVGFWVHLLLEAMAEGYYKPSYTSCAADAHGACCPTTTSRRGRPSTITTSAFGVSTGRGG